MINYLTAKFTLAVVDSNPAFLGLSNNPSKF